MEIPKGKDTHPTPLAISADRLGRLGLPTRGASVDRLGLFGRPIRRLRWTDRGTSVNRLCRLGLPTLPPLTGQPRVSALAFDVESGGRFGYARRGSRSLNTVVATQSGCAGAGRMLGVELRGFEHLHAPFQLLPTLSDSVVGRRLPKTLAVRPLIDFRSFRPLSENGLSVDLW